MLSEIGQNWVFKTESHLHKVTRWDNIIMETNTQKEDIKERTLNDIRLIKQDRINKEEDEPNSVIKKELRSRANMWWRASWFTMLWEFRLYQVELSFFFLFFFYRVLGIRLVGIVRKSIYTYLFYCSLISIFLFVPGKAMVDQKQTNKQAKDFTKV